MDATISARNVRVNGRAVWLASWNVAVGDRLDVSDPPAVRPDGPETFDPRWLVHIDDDLLVVDKPEGLRSEATRATDATPNLLLLCTQTFGTLTLAHRLDRDTSGLVLLPRSRLARQVLDDAFKRHLVAKRYTAVVKSPPGIEGTIDRPIGPDPTRRDRMITTEKGRAGDARPAQTRWAVLDRFGPRALINLRPLTGRTHQLRVHCASVGMAIIGDPVYGDPIPADPVPGEGASGEGASGEGASGTAARMMLHATELEIPPIGPEPGRSFFAPVPSIFESALRC